MENLDIHKKGWITPTIQDLDITDTQGGAMAGGVENEYEFPSFPPNPPNPPIPPSGSGFGPV